MKVRILSAELAERAKKELNEDLSSVHEDIRIIKEWLEQQKYLRARNDDQWLLSFIRGCKFSLERAKQKLDYYYTVRTLTPEMCRLDPNDAKLRHICEAGYFLPLSTLDTGGHRICVVNPAAFDSHVYNINDSIKAMCAIAEMLIMEDDDAVISGVTYVSDLSGIPMAYLTQLTPPVLKKMIAVFLESLPLRMKCIHILNAPSIFEPVFNLIKSLLPPKLRSRMFLYGKNLDEFYKKVPKDRLPLEHCGTGFSIDQAKKYWRNKLDEYEQWFSQDKNYGSDECKRPGRPKTVDSIFGIEGSFKRLTVD